MKPNRQCPGQRPDVVLYQSPEHHVRAGQVFGRQKGLHMNTDNRALGNVVPTAVIPTDTAAFTGIGASALFCEVVATTMVRPAGIRSVSHAGPPTEVVNVRPEPVSQCSVTSPDARGRGRTAGIDSGGRRQMRFQLAYGNALRSG